jgi:glutamate synthase domain-containing protein 2
MFSKVNDSRLLRSRALMRLTKMNVNWGSQITNLPLMQVAPQSSRNFHSSSPVEKDDHSDHSTHVNTTTNFPDFLEHWNARTFKKTGLGLTIGTFALMGTYGVCQETILVGGFVAGYWYVGFKDMQQKSHTILRNFPVLGNFRYIFEMIRPEIRQYFIESDNDGAPFDRNHRSLVYQRSKKSTDTQSFGTKRNVYSEGYEFASHSIYPKTVDMTKSRVVIGGKDCKRPYSASLLNISGMSYGALSDNAILALSTGAKLGGFYHNTGEGGVSKFHIDGGGDLVWNIGTGYFACRNADGSFSKEQFKKTLDSAPQIKMIEIKLSQGAKPGHGGLLPGSKVTKFIAHARGVPENQDCHSPPRHSVFNDAKGLVKFVELLRNLSDGRPIGFKLCVGRPEEFAAIVHAMLDANVFVDFITVDGAEGGTGAAPPEFSNSVGMPLIEGLTIVNNILIGAGVRDQIKIICAGKVATGFSVVRNIALGADLCNAARAMMFALGCVQALKCNTNKCPSGVATQDPDLMQGLDVSSKSVRVKNFQEKTVEYAMDIIAAMGYSSPSEIEPSSVFRRVSAHEVKSFGDLYPRPQPSSLLQGNAPSHLQEIWRRGVLLNGGVDYSSSAAGGLKPFPRHTTSSIKLEKVIEQDQ